MWFFVLNVGNFFILTYPHIKTVFTVLNKLKKVYNVYVLRKNLWLRQEAKNSGENSLEK